MEFSELNINKDILKALEEKKYKKPTEIQKNAIPIILNKKDLLGCAQTGTGKTAAFAIPIIQMLSDNSIKDKKPIRALILTPTRELAIQIRDNFRLYGKYTDIKTSVIFGGVNQESQKKVLKKGVDVIVATPGRLLDLVNQKCAKLDQVEYLILDEADTMLDMGFIHDVKKIINRTNSDRQTLLFSATMPDSIEKLSSEFLKNPEKVIVNPVSSTVQKIEQEVYFVDRRNKNKLLLDIFKERNLGSTLIFTRTKHGANKLTEFLNDHKIKAAAIHGNKSQSARVRALTNFKDGSIKVLVATDIAARGIDIKDLPHVINYEIPNISETYVHRIGRTGRAGKMGLAISLCDIDEREDFKSIEKLIEKEVNVIVEHNYVAKNLVPTKKTKKSGNSRNRSNSKNKKRNYSKNNKKNYKGNRNYKK